MIMASIQWKVWEARLERRRKFSWEDRKNTQNGGIFSKLDFI